MSCLRDFVACSTHLISRVRSPLLSAAERRSTPLRRQAREDTEDSTSDHKEGNEILPRLSGLLLRPHPSLHRDLSTTVRPPQERSEQVQWNEAQATRSACYKNQY